MKPRFFASRVLLPGLFVLIISVLVVSCGDFKKSSVVAPPSNGSVDFSVYVSIGNSLTSGYQEGALYESAQEYSYPADIAREAGVYASFKQPLMPNPGTGAMMSITSLSGPTISTASPTQTSPTDASSLLRPYNNLGVPGAVLYDMIDTTNFLQKSIARSNPFFAMILRNSAFGNSVVAQALNLHPTFVSVWIGANDVLGYAASGGTVGTLGPGSGPTDPNQWGLMFAGMMNALLTGAPNAKFVVGNLPNVTAIPFFTTIPAVVVNPATRQPILINGQPIPLIVQKHDASGNLIVAQANPQTDLICLTALDSMEAGVGIPASIPGGTGRPLPDQYVLDSYEIAKVENAISGYNSAIAAVAAANPSRVAVFNANTALDAFAKDGYVAQGVDLSASYITGGFFGLDGVHPTSQGYAYIANLFIQTINQKFGSNIPMVAISSVPSSIPLAGLTQAQKARLWQHVSYSDLKPMLQLIQRTDLR